MELKFKKMKNGDIIVVYRINEKAKFFMDGI